MPVRSLSVLAGAALTVTAVTGLAAQPVTIRYAPTVGAQVRTITGARGTITFRELTATGERSNDSVVGEMSSLAGITRRVLEATDGERVVEVTYDSLRTRRHLLGQAWKDSVLVGPQKLVFRPTLDARQHPVAGGNGDHPGDPVANGGIGSWRGVELPDYPVNPGETWQVPTVFRLPAPLGGLLEISVRDSLTGRATVRLDSVVARPADTLMYLTVQQTLGPETLPALDAGDNATVQLAGSQAGSLVWSTGWRAFVSGATQARVIGRLTTTGAAGAGATRQAEISWFLTTRLQVRP